MTASPVKGKRVRSGKGGARPVRAPGISMRPGRMTAVLETLKKKNKAFEKYDHVTDIPESKIPIFAKALARRYGLKHAKAMTRVMIILRKDRRERVVVKHRKWFERLLEELEKLEE